MFVQRAEVALWEGVGSRLLYSWSVVNVSSRMWNWYVPLSVGLLHRLDFFERSFPFIQEGVVICGKTWDIFWSGVQYSVRAIFAHEKRRIEMVFIRTDMHLYSRHRYLWVFCCISSTPSTYTYFFFSHPRHLRQDVAANTGEFVPGCMALRYRKMRFDFHAIEDTHQIICMLIFRRTRRDVGPFSSSLGR